MTQNTQIKSNSSGQDEDEIFKSLSHRTRRAIIKLLGEHNSLSFTEIKTALGNIDSPSLSYHLKSLEVLLKQEKNLYGLTEIGVAALNLMDHIDQSDRLRNSKRKFVIANIVTIVCWTIILFFIPFFIATSLDVRTRIVISIVLNGVAQINFQIIWNLWAASWKPPKIKSKKKHLNDDEDIEKSRQS